MRVAAPSPLAWLERARRRWAEATAVLPAREAGVLRAIGTGDRAGLDRETSSAFARSGLAHVLAVSGLHLVVVAWGLFRLWPPWSSGSIGSQLHADARRIAAAVALPPRSSTPSRPGPAAGAPRRRRRRRRLPRPSSLRRELDAAGALAVGRARRPRAGAWRDPRPVAPALLRRGRRAGARRRRSSARALPWPRPPRGSWRARLLEPFVEGGCATVGGLDRHRPDPRPPLPAAAAPGARRQRGRRPHRRRADGARRCRRAGRGGVASARAAPSSGSRGPSPARCVALAEWSAAPLVGRAPPRPAGARRSLPGSSCWRSSRLRLRGCGGWRPSARRPRAASPSPARCARRRRGARRAGGDLHLGGPGRLRAAEAARRERGPRRRRRIARGRRRPGRARRRAAPPRPRA